MNQTHATIQNLWQRFEAWLLVSAPQAHASLRPGASEAQIEELEKLVGVKFPADIRDSYRLHDGQAREGPWLLDGRELLSLERIAEEWKVWKDLLDGGDFDGISSDPDEFVRSDWWHPAWIPLSYDGAGNHDCLDMAPTEKGAVGQIIDFWHDDAARSVKATSFTTWLEGLVTGVEVGKYAYSEEYHGIVSVGDV
ncbi:MAG TPA: SMI1/KNR4 family protein [Candidatus Saccharimonadia bacterium]|nr:SMI1/KNR4 family protein [Candidatus Saccharimonadia bacterium]